MWFRCCIAAFNVPGVKEHAHFLKDVGDARKIRARILECASARLCPVYAMDPVH